MKRALLLFLAAFACTQMYAQLPAVQTLPFSQDWTNIGLITADDNWSGVSGIVGFRGDNITGGTGVDPQTLLADDSPGVVDVIANQTNPNTNTSGGVAEFHITNPVVAMQGSGTADAPYLLIGINTSCLSNIVVSYNVRDIDGSTDNSIQQVALQYRVGSTGTFTNIPAGYIADATTGPSLATLVTAVNVTLPAGASNQSAVYLRIMTTNAVGNDEWVGIDDISISGTPIAASIAGSGEFCLNGTLPITVSISGGTGPFSVVYTDGVNNFTESNYASGTTINQPVSADATFTLVSVTDNTGCTAVTLSGSATASVSETLPSVSVDSQVDPSCANNDGAINISVSNGQAPYAFAWTTGNGTGLNPGAEDQTGLGAGTYELVVTDDNSCQSTPATSATLTLPSGCALNYYWVGGSGLWSDFSNHWATTSGGNIFYNQVPTSMDNVFFDANSFPAGGTVTIDETIVYCRDMNWTGATNNPVLTGPADKQIWIYGSLALNSAMDWDIQGEIRFRSFESGKTIQSSGQSFDANVYFDGNGEWNFIDAFNAAGQLSLQSGTLRTQGNSVTVGGLGFENGSLFLSNSVVNLFSGLSTGTSALLDAGTSHVIFNNPSGLFASNNPTFYDVSFASVDGGEAHNCNISGKMTFVGPGVYSTNFSSTVNEIEFQQTGLIGSNSSPAPAPLFNTATFLGNGSFFGDNDFLALNLASGHLYKFQSTFTTTIVSGGTLNASGSGCNDFITLVSSTPGSAANLNTSGANLTLDYVTAMDIAVTGGGTITAQNSIDLGGNSNWNFAPLAARDLYWVGGGGNWSDPAHWSLGSGGTGGECIPTAFDNVFFDQNSGFAGSGETVSVDDDLVYCHNMTWQGTQNNPVLNTSNPVFKLFIYGSMAFEAGMDLDLPSEVHFRSNQTGETILMAGRSFNSSVYFDGAGEWNFSDAFNAAGQLFLQSGTLRTQGNNVSIAGLSFDNGSLFLSNSVVNLFSGLSTGASASLDAGTSHVIFNNASGLFASNNPTFHDVTFASVGNGEAHNCSVSGKMTFVGPGVYSTNFSSTVNEIEFQQTAILSSNSNPVPVPLFNTATLNGNGSFFGDNDFVNLNLGAGLTYKFQSTSTTTIVSGGNLNASGPGCNDFITLVSSTPGSAANLNTSGANLTLDYVTAMDLAVTGGGTITAQNSIDLGGNSGWNFSPPAARDLYWVGGGGNWSDQAHWSLSSGGAGGECIPTAFDNVFFDQNSGFAGSGETVSVDDDLVYCHNMTWQGIQNNPVLNTSNPAFKLFVYGSLAFDAGMDLDLPSEVHFRSNQTGETILMAGRSFDADVYFDGAGEWSFSDAFNAAGQLFLQSGTLRTQGNPVNVSGIGFDSGTLFLSNSVVTLTSAGMSVGTGAVLDAGTSQVIVTGAFGIFASDNPVFHDITFASIGTAQNLSADGKITFTGPGGYTTFFSSTVNEIEFQQSGVISANATPAPLFNTATFLDNGSLFGDNVFGQLTFSAGKTYVLAAGTTQTIAPLGNFIAEGTGGFPIEIKSSQLGTQATIQKDGDPVCLDFLFLTDMAATGSSAFYAGVNSDDVSNNSGWIFAACPGCFTAPALPAPVLDPASVTAVSPGQQATLILQDLPAGYEAVWFDADQMTELYADAANLFQPVVNASTTFYGAFREIATGCISELLEVQICVLNITNISTTPATCAGYSDGAITVTAQCGACQGIEYSIDGINYQSSNVFSGLTSGVYTVTARDIATPDCMDTETATVGVSDNVPPVFNAPLPANLTVSCTDPLPAPATVTASDNVDPNPSVTLSETQTPGTCPQEFTLVRTWTAIDFCGNSAQFTQTITVDDNTPPVFNAPLPQDISVSCSDPLPLAPAVTASDNCDPGQVPDVVFINEIHYDNVGTDVGEFVELAGTAGVDLSQYQIVLYNGNGGVTYDITPLSGLIDNEAGGFGAVSFGYAVNGLQNGAPDGIALIKLPNTVVQFLSYEGTFLATNGPAAGMMSADIGVAEEPAPPVGQSLQLTGAGQQYSDLNWVGPIAQTPGTLNAGESLTPLPGTIMATLEETTMAGDCNGESTLMRIWTATDACGNSSQFTQTIHIQDNTGPSFVPPIPQNITISCSDPIPAPAVLLASDNCDDGSGGPAMVWINEIHYDNVGTDVNEFIEIAGTAGVDLSAYTLYLYNGTGGGTYGTTPLSGIIPSQSNGYGTLAFTYPVNGLQNGAPDGVALFGNGMVIQFLSYEGTFVAVGGPANGMTSTDIGVLEDGTNAAGTSLRLSGNGDKYSDFTWNAPATSTPGAVNTGQTFTPAPTGLAVTFSETNTKGTDPANCNFYTYTITRTWSVEDDCGNTNSHVQVITVQDVTPPTFTGVPANVTLSCNQSIPAAPTNVTASDNCSATTPVTFTEVSTKGSNPANCNFYTYTITRTWSSTDVCGNVGKGTQVITVQDVSAPTVTCNSITVSLNIFGNVTITGASVGASGSDNCAATGNLTVASNPVTFTCAQAGTTQPYVVQISDPCGNIGVCTSQVTILPFPRCTPKILVSDPCVCKNNATTLANGQFGETIKIESLSGKTWTVIAVAGLWSANSPAPPTAPIAIPLGTQFTEIPANSGDYFLSGVHIDDLGYSITVQSESGQVLAIGNSCKYPNPVITSDLSGDFCLYSDPVTLTGIPGDNNIVSQGFTVNGVPATQFNPGAGVGQYFIEYTVNGGTPKAAGADDPGCIQKVSTFVNVVATPTNLVCNNLVHVSLDADCTEEIMPDQVLEGSYFCYDDYKVELDKTLPYGNGPWGAPFVDANDIGKTYAYKATHLVSGTFCWGNIKIEDKLPPQIECINITLNCAITTYTPDYLASVLGIQTAYPNVSDCSPVTTSYIDTWTNLECDETINGLSNISGYISRKWTAKDSWNNIATCVQIIYFQRIQADDVNIPADVTVSCGASNTTPAATGLPTVTAFGKIFPLFPEAGFCEFNATFTDQVIEICDGTYKIVRTWILFDWCLPTGANNPLYHVQLIKVSDETGPVIACPANLTVSTDPFSCCATVNLPDVVISDACSRINNVSAMVIAFDQYTGDQIGMFPVSGSVTDFPGNNYWNPDTLGAYGSTPCLPVGTHTVVYQAEDDCGNTSTCSFQLTVSDLTPPVAACTEFTVVSIGPDDPGDCYAPADDCKGGGVSWVPAPAFNQGSYDNCHDVKFTVRRMEPYSDCIEGFKDVNDCEYNVATAEGDSIKFYCCEVGTSQMVILRVYQLEADGSISVGTDGEPVYNECMVEVKVQDKIKPVCVSPGNVTVSCESFDPSLWAYGKPSVYDNCCLDTAFNYQGQCGLQHTVSYNLFDTVCNRGTINRTFRVYDCHGQSSQCTQRIIVNYEQDYWIKFPNDVVITTCDGTGNYGEPVFNGDQDCELLGVTYEDQVFTVVPDACFKIERTWTIINWCTYNVNGTCIVVPNPNPNATVNAPQNLPGPIVSPCGTPAPWAPTNVAIAPGQAPTNFCTFWDANANCYKYKQIIKIVDQQDPTVTNCPASPVEYCDFSVNDPLLWNQSYWWDGVSHDLCEGDAPLTITATDACSGANINITYLLFLDLDGDGTMETVVNSNNTPAPGTVNYNNLSNPSYSGGTPRVFDGRPVQPNDIYRWANHQSVSGTSRTASVQWKTFAQMPTPANQNGTAGIAPQLPYGTHKIKWTITDGCGNETFCEYTFIVKDCKAPTVVCFNGLSTNIMPAGMATIWATDFLQYADDNCTPSDLLIYSIRKAGQGTGFPVDAQGNPILSLTFDCSELGPQPVELWAQDLAGNAAYCQTFIDIQDPFNNCTNGNKIDVAGALKTEGNDGLEDANVNLQSGTTSLFDMTDQDGAFTFPNSVDAGVNYTVTPTKDDNPLNGVSTYDLVLISKHILGLEPLSTPFKMIAADANKSNSITTFDIVEIRKLILGIYTELPNNTSWRFVDKAYSFPNPANPFQTQFPETKSVAGATVDQLADDFTAVKVGDVNGTAIANSLLTSDDRTAGTLLFDVEDRAVKAGETFTLTFKGAERVQGYQFTMNFAGLEVLNVTPGSGMTTENFGVFADALTTSVDGEGNEFAVTFRAAKAGQVSEMLSVSSRVTRAEAYSVSNNRLDVAFRFRSPAGMTISSVGFELYQNQPNPFVNKTVIGFHLPEAAEATLSVYDESGRMLFTQKGQFTKGYNAISVDRALLNTTGLMYYKLETATDAATKKMIQTK